MDYLILTLILNNGVYEYHPLYDTTVYRLERQEICEEICVDSKNNIDRFIAGYCCLLNKGFWDSETCQCRLEM